MRDAAPPRAAVIIPAHDAEATLARAVRSALAQTVAAEVVVVDDASRDATAEVGRALAAAEPRVRLVVLPRNRGPAAARNAGVAASSAPWICPLDADDVMENPRRLEILLARAEGWDIVADDLWLVEEGALAGPRRRLAAEADFGSRTLDLAGFVESNLSRPGRPRRELGFLKPALRRAFLERHGLAYDPRLRFAEDYDLYARALARGARFRLIDPAGYLAVRRAGSLSHRQGAREIGALVAADRRLLEEQGLPRAARRALRRHLGETRRLWAWLRLIEAVKARDPAAALGCFRGPPSVALSLLANLAAQARLRGGRLARRALPLPAGARRRP